MKLITMKNILNAKEQYLCNEQALYIIDDNDIAFGFCKEKQEWNEKRNFWDYFDSSEMLVYLKKISKEEAIEFLTND